MFEQLTQNSNADPHSIRARLGMALSGEPLDRPVYAVYDWFVKNRNINWPCLFELGLGQINHASLVKYKRPNVEIIETTGQQQERLRRDVRWITDIGELHEWYLDNWRQEYLIKSREDYRIMRRALEGASVTADPEGFLKSEEALGEAGITVGDCWRTPVMEAQIDLVGLERFSIDLALEEPELMQLLEVMTELKLMEFREAVKTPAQIIKLWENLSIDTLGPLRYISQLVPIYEQILKILDRTGKSLTVHYDGKVKLIAEQFAALHIDGIDSFTPQPEGDMSIAEARSAWPDKFLWIHPPMSWHRDDPATLAANIRQAVREAGPCRFCFLLSEEVPLEWEKSIPVILNSLDK